LHERLRRMQPDAVMITQAVDEDDPILGFTVGWVNALAENLRRLSVFCLRTGKHRLRDNVSLRVLEGGKTGRLRALERGLKSDLKEMEVAAIFAHMCPRYAVAARRIVRAKVPIILWYAHSAKSLWLRLAHRVSRVVLTPTAESCPIASQKVRVVGHGIDTEKFSPTFENSKRSPRRGWHGHLAHETLHARDARATRSPRRGRNGGIVLLSAGRIAPLKRYEFLIEAFAEAASSFSPGEIVLRILGSPCLPEDERYFSRLKRAVRQKGIENVVEFRAAVAYSGVEAEYADCDLFVSTAFRHSIDKAPLEAMACGKVLLTSNRNFRPLLGRHAELLVADDEHPGDLAGKIVNLARMEPSERQKMGLALRDIVLRDHDLKRLMRKIAETMTELRSA